MSRLLKNTPGWGAPLLVSAFFSLECFVELKPFGTLPGLALTFAVSAAAGLMAYLAARLILRDREKAALWTTVFLLTFYFFSYILTVLHDIPAVRNGSRRYVLLALGCSWAILLAALKGKRLWAPALRQFSTIALLLLIAYGGMRALLPVPPPPTWGGNRAPFHISKDSPDIYYIILDGHTSPESLQRYWNYDASWFVQALNRAGFHVVSNAQANLDSTAYCMATTFNMKFPPKMPHEWKSFARGAYIMRCVENGDAKRLLKDAGYKVIELSIFPGLDGAPPAYRHSSALSITVPGLALMKTPLGHAAEHVWVRQQGNSSIRMIEKLQDIVATPSAAPRFIYAHILLPHAPYFFDRDGNQILKGVGPEFRDATKDDYLNQLIYVDRVVTNALARILATAKRPPVIVIQSDHGFRNLSPREARDAESLTILNAMLLPPGIGNAEPYSGITPVNTFRLLFNRYFSTRLAYVPDHSAAAATLSSHGAEHSQTPYSNSLPR